MATFMARLPATAARALIRVYQLTLSGIAGRQCRHLPSCSEFCDEAIRLHGFWAGGWMGLARLSRCRPFGSSGHDPVPVLPPARGAWFKPWAYGAWSAKAMHCSHDRDHERAASAAERDSSGSRIASGKDSATSR